jgi:alpha-1,3-glucan synthase
VFWQDNGTIVPVDNPLGGCMQSDFDQYGDMEAFGVHPDWQRQLSKFASVQDRLREWSPSVMAKLQNFACMVITALDVDAMRIDKSTQVTVAGLSEWAAATRTCATNLGKTNFYITGEVTGGNTFGALYMYDNTVASESKRNIANFFTSQRSWSHANSATGLP